MSILGSDSIAGSEPDRTQRADALGQQEDDLRDEVVEAAKALLHFLEETYDPVLDAYDGAYPRFARAVGALLIAERPRCNHEFASNPHHRPVCGRPAVQTLKPPLKSDPVRHRCEQHREEVITYDNATR